MEEKTKGYKNHPEIRRFKSYKNPIEAINSYLTYIWLEAERRNFNFNASKIKILKLEKIIPITTEELRFEFEHLIHKLKARDYNQFMKLRVVGFNKLDIHPVFFKCKG